MSVSCNDQRCELSALCALEDHSVLAGQCDLLQLAHAILGGDFAVSARRPSVMLFGELERKQKVVRFLIALPSNCCWCCMCKRLQVMCAGGRRQ